MATRSSSDNMATTESDTRNPEKVEGQTPSDSDNTGEQEKCADPNGFGEAPDGGLRAWLAAAGGASVFFCCLGFANSFGVFQEYYMTHQLKGQSSDRVAWIGSLGAFIQFAAGAVGGPIFDRYGDFVVRPAAVAYVFAIMMISLCKEYWQFMLAQGVLVGVVIAFLQVPAMGAVTQYFDKKRAAALGLIISGSSVGGVVFPIAFSKMLNSSSLGFGWSVRIMGFVMIPFMAFAALTIKARLPPRKTNFFIKAAFTDAKFLLLVASLFFMLFAMFTPLFFLPSYAVTRHMGPALASYLVAIVNASSTFGRIISGVFADKYGRSNTFALAGFSSGIIVFCMNQATTTAGLVVFAIFFGFSSGMIVSAGAAAISLCPANMQDMGTYLGMGMAMASAATLIGPPVSGAMVEEYGGYSQVCIFAGVMSLVGGCVALVSKLLTPQGIFGKL